MPFFLHSCLIFHLSIYNPPNNGIANKHLAKPIWFVDKILLLIETKYKQETHPEPHPWTRNLSFKTKHKTNDWKNKTSDMQCFEVTPRCFQQFPNFWHGLGVSNLGVWNKHTDPFRAHTLSCQQKNILNIIYASLPLRKIMENPPLKLENVNSQCSEHCIPYNWPYCDHAIQKQGWKVDIFWLRHLAKQYLLDICTLQPGHWQWKICQTYCAKSEKNWP